MDAARQGYYRVYGGAPGLTWLLDGFSGAARGARVSAAVRDSPVRRRPRRGRSPSHPLDRVRGGRRMSDGAADERRRVARPPVVVRSRDRGRGARRVRPGRPRGDARRRASTLAIRDQERAGIDVVTDGEMRRAGLLHRRVLPAPDRRPGAARRVGGWVPAATTSSTGSRSRADRGARRPRRRRRVPLRAHRATDGRSR